MWLSLILARSLKARLAEYLAAAAVVAVAVSVIAAVRAVTAAADAQIHDLAHNLGNNMLVVPASADLADFYAYRYRGEGLPDSYPEKLLASELGMHIRSLDALLFGNVRAGNVPLVAVGETAYQGGSPGVSWPEGEAVLGRAAWRKLGLDGARELGLGGQKFRITDIADDPPEGLDTGVFIAMSAAQRLLGRAGRISSMRLAGCWCKLEIPALAAEVEKLLPGTRAVTVAGVIKAQTGAVAAVRRYSSAIHAGALCLIMGIVSILTAYQVRRNRRELGLLLATGAQPRLIAALFVLKAALAGALGAAAGAALAVFLLRNAAGLLAPAAVIPGIGAQLPWLLALSAGASAAAALLPALGAARLDPVEVIREE
ncbi:MAG: hypothetical protein M0011_15230 [Elusimicrobia bacterium]|nr:hypothetical protein [Elusimicrobiota bacterium]